MQLPEDWREEKQNGRWYLYCKILKGGSDNLVAFIGDFENAWIDGSYYSASELRTIADWIESHLKPEQLSGHAVGG